MLSPGIALYIIASYHIIPYNYSITLYHIISHDIIYGPCDDAFPSSLRAELWAILHTLRMAIPPLTIWTDSEGVAERWSKGETWCCAACRLAADLWRDIWRLLGDMGPGDVHVVKVKGHATDADVSAGRSTPWQRACKKGCGGCGI